MHCSNLGFCSLCQLAMSPTNVATSMDKMEKCWVLHGRGRGRGSKLLRWRNARACSIRVGRVSNKFEAEYDELHGTHNGMMTWKYFGE